MKKLLLIFFLLLISIIHYPLSSFALSELEKIEQEITELNQALQQSVDATAPLEKSLSKLEADLKQIQDSIARIDADLLSKKQQIVVQELELDEKLAILSEKVYQFYKRTVSYNPFFELLLGRGGFGARLREMAYRQSVANHDKQVITEIVLFVTELEQKKAALEVDLQTLGRLKQKTDEQAEFFRSEIKGAREYQVELSKQIAELTVRQQEILAQKLASLNLPTSLGAGPLFCTDDRKLDPGFSPGFAFYTFGIPHRVGMNQYGAYGRANSGQSYQDILRAYYEGINFEKRPNINIKVQGYGEMSLEQYLLGVYEMPESWPIEALKAQVVAARSYALAYGDNGAKEICTSQKCQVYKGGNKGGNWEVAVKATEGEVMVSSGQVITAWYASTSGGYTFTSADVGWSNRSWTKRTRDTNGEINSFSDLLEKAYDKDSPCFYAAQGFRNEYGKSAWLKPNEVADIVNVLLLAKSDSSIQKHLSQVDKPNPDGVETWDAEKVKQELRSRGATPYDNISDVSLDWDKSLGKITTVKVSGDAGSNSFEGAEFKNFFNLRAPANIQIVGPLFNIERK